MNNMIITFEDGSKKEYRKGTKFGEIVEDVAPFKEIICGNFNNTIVNYDDPIAKNGKLILYDINTVYGNRTYEKGLTFLFKVCAYEVLGTEYNIKIRQNCPKSQIFIHNKISIYFLISISRIFTPNPNTPGTIVYFHSFLTVLQNSLMAL